MSNLPIAVEAEIKKINTCLDATKSTDPQGLVSVLRKLRRAAMRAERIAVEVDFITQNAAFASHAANPVT